MEFCYIYGLYELSDVKKTIRYVGKTITPIEKRCKRHINEAKRKSYKKSGRISKKNKWIINCSSKGIGICTKLIETVKLENWKEREIYWISKFDNLYNTAPGGFGGSGKLYEITYESCKDRVKKFGIKSKSQWLKFIKNENFPKDMPNSPRDAFLNSGWISWMDFLGTNNECSNLRADKYLTYKEASIWIKSNLNIKNNHNWIHNVKCGNIPDFIPNIPYRFYNKKNRGWISWVDFLNSDRCFDEKRRFIAYNELRNELSILGIKKKTEYIKRYKGIAGAPSNPWYHYDEWLNWKKFICNNEGK